METINVYGENMVKETFQGLSLPKSLLDIVKERVAKDKRYTNVTEFIRVAIREKLENDNDSLIS